MSTPREQTSPYPDAGAARGGDRTDPRPAQEPEGAVTSPDTVAGLHDQPAASADDSTTTGSGRVLP